MVVVLLLLLLVVVGAGGWVNRESHLKQLKRGMCKGRR